MATAALAGAYRSPGPGRLPLMQVLSWAALPPAGYIPALGGVAISKCHMQSLRTDKTAKLHRLSPGCAPRQSGNLTILVGGRHRRSPCRGETGVAYRSVMTVSRGLAAGHRRAG
jgi:hypothetical protein